MSPEILLAKLALLQQILSDLRPHISAKREDQEAQHYEIERQVQLCVDLCVTIGRRILILKQVSLPSSAREVFHSLKKERIISKQLAEGLSSAVGLRNLIVHEYGNLDYDIFFSGLKMGYQSFVKFASAAAKLTVK